MVDVSWARLYEFFEKFAGFTACPMDIQLYRNLLTRRDHETEICPIVNELGSVVFFYFALVPELLAGKHYFQEDLERCAHEGQASDEV